MFPGLIFSLARVFDTQMREAIAAGGDIYDRTDPLPEACRSLADDIRTLQSEGTITEQTAEEAIGSLG